jgi:hypothetical protein
MSRRPNAAQRTFNAKLPGSNKNGLRRAQQIRASQRSFVYDGALAPTCLSCGQPRENRRGLKCERCQS